MKPFFLFLIFVTMCPAYVHAQKESFRHELYLGIGGGFCRQASILCQPFLNRL